MKGGFKECPKAGGWFVVVLKQTKAYEHKI
jgi:hypothetical protein